MNTVLELERPMYYQRIAIKPDANGPWQWFGPPIAFSVAHWYTATIQIEALARQAMLQHELNPLRQMKLVQAPKEEVHALVDMWED